MLFASSGRTHRNSCYPNTSPLIMQDMAEGSTKCFACWNEMQGEHPVGQCSHGVGFCSSCAGALLQSFSSERTLQRSFVHPHCGVALGPAEVSNALQAVEPVIAQRFLETILPAANDIEEVTRLVLTDTAYLSALLSVHYDGANRLNALMGGLHTILQYKDMKAQLCPWASNVVQTGAAASTDPASTISSLAAAGLECMAIHCPRCGVLLDQAPAACSAFYHRACGSHFCFVCFAPALSLSDSHNHVSSIHGNLYISAAERSLYHEPFRENAIKLYLSLLPGEKKVAVLEKMIETVRSMPGSASDVALLERVREMPEIVPFAEVLTPDAVPAQAQAELVVGDGARGDGKGYAVRLLQWLRVLITHNLMAVWGWMMAKRYVAVAETTIQQAAIEGAARAAIPTTVASATSAAAGSTLAGETGKALAEQGSTQGVYGFVRSWLKPVAETLRGSKHSASMLMSAAPRLGKEGGSLDLWRDAAKSLRTSGGTTLQVPRPLTSPTPALASPSYLPGSMGYAGATAGVGDWVFSSATDAIMAARGTITLNEAIRRQPRRLATAGVKGALTTIFTGAYCCAGGPLATSSLLAINVAASMAGSALVVKVARAARPDSGHEGTGTSVEGSVALTSV